MISGYVRPQLIIKEVLQTLPNIDQLSLHAFTFGPQFDLFRYYVDAERADMNGVAFTYNTSTLPEDQQLVPYEGKQAFHIPDAAFSKLYAENIEGLLWTAASPTAETLTAPYAFQIPSLSTPNQILVSLRGANITVYKGSIANGSDYQMTNETPVLINFPGAGYPASTSIFVPVIDATGFGQGAVVKLTTNADGEVTAGLVISPGYGYRDDITIEVPGAGTEVGTAGEALIPDLHGRPISAGDVLYTTVDGNTIRRLVTGVTQQTQPASVGLNGTGQFVSGVTNPSLQATNYFGNVATPYNWNLNLACSSLLDVTIASAGSGYTTAPVITVSAPTVVNPTAGSGQLAVDNTLAGIESWTTTQAAAEATVSGGAITAVQVTEPGTGYFNGGVVSVTVTNAVRGTAGMYSLTNPPVIVIAPPTAANGIQATAIAYVSPGGAGFPDAGKLLAIEVTNPGAGYGSAPAVTVVGGTATAAAQIVAAPTAVPTGNASLTTVVQSTAADWNGLVQGSTYQGSYGERYTITVTTSGTTGARLRIRSSSGAFTADGVTPTVRGNYYTITHAALGGLAVQLQSVGGSGLLLGQQFSFVVKGKYLPLVTAPTGQVLEVNVIVGGSTYVVGDALVFSAPPAGGVQAQGEVATVSSGVITSVVITNPGSGYQYAPLATITSTAGTGAMLQVVVANSQTGCDIALVPGTTYNGTVNNRYTVTVVQGTKIGGQNSFEGAVVRVQDTAGVDVATEIDVQQGVNYNLGSYGLQFNFPSNQVTPTGLAPGVTATLDITEVDSGTGEILAVTVTDGGYGYAVPPVLTIGTSTGSDAVLQAVLNNGVIESVVVISGGADYEDTDTVTAAAPVEYQLGLRTGDVYYLDVVAPAKSGAYNTVVLNGLAADITGWAPTDVNVNLLDIDLRQIYTGQIGAQGDPTDAPNLQWTTSADGLKVKDTLKVYSAARNTNYQWLPVQTSRYARLFASWRGLVPATGSKSSNATPTRYYSSAAIVAAFGVNDQDNPACYGAVTAFNGAQGKSVFAASLATNDLAGYTAVLNSAARIQGPYSLAPMTNDPDIYELVKTHVDSCSVENKKLWRRAYVSTASPGKYAVYQEDADGNALQGSVLSDGSGNVRVVAPDALFITENVLPGDLYRTYFVADAWGNQAYQEFPILQVLENEELILSSGPTAPISPATRFEIWRPDTGRSQAIYAGNIATNLDDRRVVNVWVDNPTTLDSLGQYVVTPVYYAAAEIAGLRSALLPQQGLTYTQLQYSVTAAPTMYTKYTDEDLDVAASNGVMIVTQETAGGPMFIRHQLTTDTFQGALYYEDSVGANFDNIAYTFKAILQPYIGQRNATPQVVEELYVRARSVLDAFKNAPTNGSLIGPAIIDHGALFVGIDDTFRDRINMSAKVVLPLPLNVITLTLFGTTLNGSVSISTTISTAA